MGRFRRTLRDGYLLERRRPSALRASEIETAVKILREGGAVDPQTARKELPRCKTVVFVRNNSKIVAVGAVKSPRPDYARRKRADSGYVFDENLCELGYIAVAKGHGGHDLSSPIVDALLARYKGDLFATTDKPKMKFVLGHRRFVQRGHEWRGDNAMLSLWMLEGRNQRAAYKNKEPGGAAAAARL